MGETKHFLAGPQTAPGGPEPPNWGLSVGRPCSIPNVVARLINQCRHGNTTMRALCIFDLHVAFNNIETLSVVMETQKRLSFVLLSSYKTFHIAVNKTPYKSLNTTFQQNSVQVPQYHISTTFRTSPSIPHFNKIPYKSLNTTFQQNSLQVPQYHISTKFHTSPSIPHFNKIPYKSLNTTVVSMGVWQGQWPLNPFPHPTRPHPHL